MCEISPLEKIHVSILSDLDPSKLSAAPKADSTAVESSRPYYMLADLLASSDYSRQKSSDCGEWVNTPRTGGELL